MKIHHIGYLVKNMQESINEFQRLGFCKSEVIFDEGRQIDICFLNNDTYKIELVSPKSTESAVGGLLKKYACSPYHICYEVSDIELAKSELALRCFVMTQDACTAPAINNQKVAFFYHKDIGLIELLEVIR